MTEREYVDTVLQVPVTRVGFTYIVESIEYIMDTHDTKFYTKLSEITGKSTRVLEKTLRDAKNLGLSYMDEATRKELFPSGSPTTTEYIIRATEHYRRNYYENKGKG